MADVRSFGWRPFAIPLRAPLGAAHGTTHRREGILVRLESDDGIVGLGEATPLPSYGGGSIDEVGRVMEWLLETFPGDEREESDAPDGVSEGTWNAVACAMDTARESIEAERAGLALWQSLRPERRRRSADRMISVPVNALIGEGTPDEAVEAARAFVEAGYRTVKLKAGFGLDLDLERMARVRKVIGPFIGLRIDANGAWSAEDASRLLEAAEQYVVQLVEQPAPHGPEALSQMAALARRFPDIRIAADESCRTLDDVEQIAGLGAPLAIVVKPMVSGLSSAVLMLRLAEEAEIPAIVTTTIDAGVATAAAMHLAGTLPGDIPACGLGTLDLLEGDIVSGVPAIKAGRIALDSTPGLGVVLDDGALDRYAAGPWRHAKR